MRGPSLWTRCCAAFRQESFTFVRRAAVLVLRGIKAEPLEQYPAVVIERRKRALHHSQAALGLTRRMPALVKLLDALFLPVDMFTLRANVVFGAVQLLADIHRGHRGGHAAPDEKTPAMAQRSPVPTMGARRRDISAPARYPAEIRGRPGDGMNALLTMARKHVVDGGRCVARQTEIIERLQALGYPTATAQELRETMIVSLSHMVEDRNHIERLHLRPSPANATDPRSGNAASLSST